MCLNSSSHFCNQPLINNFFLSPGIYFPFSLATRVLCSAIKSLFQLKAATVIDSLQFSFQATITWKGMRIQARESGAEPVC